MLTGTLVTAAGFLPIGFANSAVGEYAGGIFWIVAISLVASWFVAVIFTPYIGVKLLPQHHGPPQPRPARGLRDPDVSRPARRDPVVRQPPRHRGGCDRRHFRGVDRGVRPCPAAVLPALGAARTVLAVAAAGRHRLQCHREIGEGGRRRCSRTTRTSRPTPPMSGRARRASGSASTRNCRTRPLPKS